MTVDEIKATYSMRDILERYGMRPNRAGFCKCPFHLGDREASMKIYDKDFNCFGCGANGDIFTFVQKMDGLTFREAFLSLGGTYEKQPSFSSRMAIYKARKAKEQRLKEQDKLSEKKQLNNMLIHIYRSYMERSEPFSDIWCDSYNALQYQLYIQSNLNELIY